MSTLTKNGKSPDFVLCIGDDRSDEDMFESILNKSYGGETETSSSAAEIFACTVGQKPSKARYYLDDSVKVMMLLQGLGAAAAEAAAKVSAETSSEVCSEDVV